MKKKPKPSTSMSEIPSAVTISNCTFHAENEPMTADIGAVIRALAEAAEQNARAIRAITELHKQTDGACGLRIEQAKS